MSSETSSVGRHMDCLEGFSQFSLPPVKKNSLRTEFANRFKVIPPILGQWERSDLDP